MGAITVDTINPKVRAMEYAVRGAIVTRAGEIEAQLKKDPASLPFDKIVMCNIGNPQSVGQKPITFYRQVLALTDYPQLMDAPEAGKLFPSDVISTAKHILGNMKGGTGAYSESKGVAALRQMAATSWTASGTWQKGEGRGDPSASKLACNTAWRALPLQAPYHQICMASWTLRSRRIAGQESGKRRSISSGLGSGGDLIVSRTTSSPMLSVHSGSVNVSGTLANVWP